MKWRPNRFFHGAPVCTTIARPDPLRPTPLGEFSRVSGASIGIMRYRFEQWELDWNNRELRRGAQSIGAEPKVLHFLYLMVSRHGRLVTRDELTRELWPNVAVGEDALTRLVKEARRAIADDGIRQRLLLTRRGHGYFFAGAVETIPDAVLSQMAPSRNSDRAAGIEVTGETTATEQGSLDTRLTVQWIIPCRRITPIAPRGATRFGRASSCEEVLDGAGVSREHAVCQHQGPITIIRDLASRNGTYLNGELVTQSPLASQDVLRIGSWLGIVAPALNQCSETKPCDGELARRSLALARSAFAAGHVVNIWGEPGAGKSYVANLISDQRPRGSNVVTLAAQGNQLHAKSERGPAMAWDSTSARLSESSDGGTLLIDNLETFTGQLTAELTEFLAQDWVRSWRLVTTSVAPLARLVASGTLPKPLYKVLSGADLALPPLRQRRAEIVEFAASMAAELWNASEPLFTIQAAEALMLYSWPLNFVELKDTIGRLLKAKNPHERIELSDLPPQIANSGSARGGQRRGSLGVSSGTASLPAERQHLP